MVNYVPLWLRVTHALANGHYALVAQTYEMNSLILTLIICVQHFLSVGHISDNNPCISTSYNRLMQHAVHYVPLWLGGKRGTDSTLTKEGCYGVSSHLNLKHDSLLRNPLYMNLE